MVVILKPVKNAESRKPPKKSTGIDYLPKVHFGLMNKPICGIGRSMYYKPFLARNLTEVTCKHCRNYMENGKR